MNLTGNLHINGYNYFIQMNDVKASMSILLFTPYHEEDVIAYEMNDIMIHPVLSSELMINKDLDISYLAEGVKRLKTSGRVFVYKQSSIIENLLNAMSFANNYSFATKDIFEKRDYYSFNENIISFKAQDENLEYAFSKIDGLFTSLDIKYGDMQLHLHTAKTFYKLSSLNFKEIEGNTKKNILVNTIKVIDYQMLCDLLDMSWYKTGDVLHKDYCTVKTIRDFELQVITPIILAAVDAGNSGKELDLTLDTETTGLNIYNLAKDNPDKDHCVAIPMSWQEDTGVVIFTDMEYFNNIPNEYVASRLSEFLVNFDGEREIAIYVEDEKPVSTELDNMNLFNNSQVETIQKTSLENLTKRKVKIWRKFFNLIGHNVIFDGKVMKDIGCPIYFNNDTLQMAFDLNPTLIKGSNKLKTLTRKLFNHETPELTDILGKGNEDKYRYLSVEEVAKIYGCADGDYTLKVFHVLRNIMSKRMYTYYQMQDVPILNILYHSEYYGMTCIEEKLQKEAEISRGNLEILKNFIYEYVGVFVSVYKQRMILDKKKQAGYLTDEQYREEISNIKVEWGQKFIFELKASEIRNVLYEILKYPILGYTAGKKKLPKTDKYVIEKLKNKKRSEKDTHFTKLERDVLVYGTDRAEYDALVNSENEKKRKKAEHMCLISAAEFNKSKYPLAIALQKYAELNKEYTSYFSPMEQTNMEGRIFKNYSLARIETRRIMNPGQTMKGNLKALVRSYTDDYYLLDFDMSQVEYRIMLSLAGFMLMIDKMNNPEKDYHTETASLINSIPAHKIDKKTRKNAKSVSFGVPYGLGIRSLCDKLFGAINDDTLLATRMLLAKWESANGPIMEFLNQRRDDALLAREMTKELRDFMDAWEKDEDGNYILDAFGNKIPTPTGFSYNEFGFYRTYNLKDIDNSPAAQQRRSNGVYTNEEGKIRRPAGNYPIQCFAAELFRIILIRFYNRCVKEGIADKVIWHMLIHDELLCSVHKSIHPFFIYKIVKESCMITMKGHTKYFVGINIGNTWAETKDDAREAPVYFVERMVRKWDNGDFGSGPFWFDDPWEELIKEERAKYVNDRIYEVIHTVQPDIDTEPINIPHILEHFDNYTVRAYVNDYDTNYDIDKSKFDTKEVSEADEYTDRVWVSKFETWALGKFGAGKPMYDYDNRLIVLRDRSAEKEASTNDDLFDFVDFSDLFDDDTNANNYWSFDEVEANDTYDTEYIFYNEDDLDDLYEFDFGNAKTAKNLAQMLAKKKEFEYIKLYDGKAIITANGNQVMQVKEFLKPYIARDGLTVMIKTNTGIEPWVKVKTKVDFKELDDLLIRANNYEMSKRYKAINFKLLNDQIIITVKDDSSIEKLEHFLEPYHSSKGQSVLVKTYLGRPKRLSYYQYIPMEELDTMVGNLK